MSADRDSKNDSCNAAVMAAMEAIGDHCGDERVPVEAEDGIVVMAPKEDLQQVRSMTEPDMNDRTVRSMMEDAEWLGDWTESVCTSAGYEKGTSECDDCRLRFARQILQP